MQIDPFTLGAQIFNFALLLVLLRWVLYRPILDAVQRREDEVAKRLEEARTTRQEAEAEAERYRRKVERIDEERTRALTEARQEAEALGERLKAEVREEVDILRREWREALDRERETFLSELRASVSRQAFAIAKQALRELANAGLEEQVVKAFVGSLSELSADDRVDFEEAARTAEGGVRVRSSVRFAPEQRNTVRQALEEWLGRDTEVTFDADPDLVLGVEVLAADKKIGWSVASHLDALEAEARTLMERATK